MNQTAATMETTAFLELLGRSRLANPESLDRALTALRKTGGGQLADDASVVGKSLVEAGIISDWQLDKLLQGRWRGFFLGRYRIMKPLGAGGMGTVYLAEHQVMGHLVAIKVLPKKRVESPGMLERFVNEARTAAMLDHPNIARATDISVDDGQPYIVMEYVQGTDVHKMVARQGPLPVDLAIKICGQAASGLQHAHQRNVIHRDIKPSNLLMNKEGVVKILDMGLAHWKDSDGPQLTSDGTQGVLGTADFLSPEQALHSRGVDGRSDIYSLGCTLHFLLTGKPPFIGNSLAQRLAMHQTAKPPSLSQTRQDCPAGLDEVFQRMMAKKPEDRFATAGDLIQSLKNLTGNSRHRSKKQSAATASFQAKSITSQRDTQAALLDDTGAGDPLSSLGDDLLSSVGLPAMPAAAPSYLTAAIPSPALHPGNYGAPATPAPKKNAKEEAEKRIRNLMIGFAVVSLVFCVSVGIYYLTKSDRNSDTGAMIRTTEGGGGQVIIINK